MPPDPQAEAQAPNSVPDAVSTSEDSSEHTGGGGQCTFPSLTGGQDSNSPALATKLEELAHHGTLCGADYVTIQPCTNPQHASQDRFVIEDWPLPQSAAAGHGDGGMAVWRFRAIFDGHAGHETVDYTVAHLPQIIKRALEALLQLQGPHFETSDVSRVLSESISSFDKSLESAFLGLFPKGVGSFDALSDEEIEGIVNEEKNAPVVLRCMRGTTVLVTLTDPTNANLWVASLGDCRAILGRKKGGGQQWTAEMLSFIHNGMNPVEANKTLQEHPGEPTCIEDGRVLGSIAVTRAIGDHLFKLPATYTRRAFLNCKPGFRISRKVEDILPRVVTPPYVSHVPEISHVTLSSNVSGEAHQEEYVLLLFSDGLSDLYEHNYGDAAQMPGFWSLMVRAVMVGAQPGENLAFRFLHHALAGEDESKASFMLANHSNVAWMDDTTVLVQRL